MAIDNMDQYDILKNGSSVTQQMPGPAAMLELRPGAASGCVAGWICDWTSATAAKWGNGVFRYKQGENIAI